MSKFLDYVTINPKITLNIGDIYPFVEMGNVSTCYREPVNIELKPFDSGVKFQDGDTVIARITPCLQNGKRFFCKNIGVGFGSTEFLVFRPKNNNELDNRFLYYFMQKDLIVKKMIASMTGATGRQRVNNAVFQSLDVVFPDIDTQRRIADILSAYDDLIENSRKQIKLLEEAAQRLYREWFVDMRFPGHEDTAIVDGVPEGWKDISIDGIAYYLNGYAFKPSDWGTVGKPIVKIKEMKNGVAHDTPRNTGDYIPEKYIVRAGDILFSWSATLFAMIWHSEEGLLNQHIFKVIPHKTISREYILQSILYSLAEFQNLTTGATMKHIQRGKLQDVFVMLPDSDIMSKFARCADTIREQILTLHRKILLSTEARDRLLPKLMSGEIKV